MCRLVAYLGEPIYLDSVVCAGMQPPVVPYFGEGADLIAPSSGRRKFPTNVLNNPNSQHNSVHQASTPPHEVLSVGKFDLLARALAFQDLQRLVSDNSEVAVERRAVLFAKHWSQLLAATCGMIDATALQVFFTGICCFSLFFPCSSVCSSNYLRCIYWTTS